MTRCFVGLGSNQSDPVSQLREACSAFGRLPGTRLLAHSSLYRSAPMGPQDQPLYINAVVMLESALAPLALLDGLQAIEQAQGRVRNGERWGPRTLDLDILLFGDRSIDEERLRVPHYHMHKRAFVLYPLAELAPDLRMPDGTSLQELLSDCPYEDIERLNEKL